MTIRLKQTIVRLACALTPLFAVVSGCGETTVSPTDSETHFLDFCDRECPGTLECICGVCTRACDANASCQDLLDVSECANSCSATTAPTRICDVSCASDGDCSALGSRFHCTNGRCRAGLTGSGGSSGIGGSGAAGRSTGTSGNGSGGAAGAPGGGTTSAGGAGGEGPLPSACNADPDPAPVAVPPNELDPDLIATAAVIVGSCNPDDGVDRNASHMWERDLGSQRFYQRSALQAQCLANARCGCDAVRHCLGIGVEPVEGTCVPHCEGDVNWACTDEIPAGYQYRIDCAKVGLSCDVLAYCTDRPTEACDPETVVASCNADGEAEFCSRATTEHTAACSSLGLVCLDGACTGDGAACTGGSLVYPDHTEIFGVSCSDANTLQACVEGHLASVACASRGPGFTCQTVGTTSFCGLAGDCIPATEGAPSSSNPASCDGPVLTFCNAGRLEHIDCTSLGFTGCNIDKANDQYGCIPGFTL